MGDLSKQLSCVSSLSLIEGVRIQNKSGRHFPMKLTVWHSAVATTFILTSPGPGGATITWTAQQSQRQV